MIAAELMGGLGNQLFQIFAVIAHGLRHGYSFGFQRKDFLEYGTRRPTYWTNLLQELDPFLLDKLTDLQPIPEAENIPLGNRDNILLVGYYQSEQYFVDVYERIVRLLKLREQRKAVIQKYYPSWLEQTTIVNRTVNRTVRCSVHFRISGYRETDCHPVLSVDYYRRAITLIREKFKANADAEVEFIIFCQPEDVEEVNSFGLPGTLIDPSIPDYEQLLLMSGCSAHIIANSTFSWWAAYIGGGFTLAPMKWFSNGYKNADLLRVKRWTYIE